MKKGRALVRVAGCFAAIAIAAGAATAVAQERLAVLSEPGTPVVATEILLSVGPADEDADQAGITNLAARSVLAPARLTLDSLGAHLNINPQKDAISIAVIAAPDVWEEATRTVFLALFRDSPDSLSMVRERQAIVAELRSRAANPADAATREMDRGFFGAAHPWGRPTLGTTGSVGDLSVADVRAFLRANFTPERAFVAVAGPVDEEDAADHIQPMLGTGPPAPVEMLPFEPAEEPVQRDYDSITTWVSASYRFPETGDEEALRFVAHLATNELSYSLSQSSVYNVWSEIVPRVGGGEIRLQVVIPPEEADEWARRIEEVIPRMVDRPMLEDVFEGQLRSFYGERLMRLIAPEDRAHAAARRLMLGVEEIALVPPPDSMTEARMRAAARSLGDPTIVLLGPDLDQ